jgi:hypothetical protein
MSLTKTEIVNQMIGEMPYQFLESSRPYIEEAMQIYSDQKNSWTRIEQRKPIATESGGWDGLKSEPVFVIDKEGKHHVAVMYEGNADNGYFYEFCDDRDFEVKNVTHWMEIPSVTNQMCYKSNKPCKYGCAGLCRESC